ncbi:MAG: biotin/lipoyl-binding protein [Aerococcaceae bacterium]|nr:biotin/lipoyl-binding protein [Aerococcaceae bacterium]
MSTKRKLIIAIVGGLVFLGIVMFSIWNIFFGQSAVPMTQDANGNPVAIGENGEMPKGEVVYQTHLVFPQEPITLNGMAQLQSDSSYFYDATLGEIETIHVRDGQTVKKGDLLYSYYLDKNKYDLEDATREQTNLYNQRVELINQLTNVTGEYYNYQGDLISTYWATDGKQQYYVLEPIGKTTVAATPSAAAGEEAEAPAADAEGIKAQIRQVNKQIEDVEIKLIRLKEQQYGQVKAKFSGKVVLDEQGKDNSQIPLVRIISDEVAVTGSVTEYEFYTLANDRNVNLFVNAEERNVAGKMVEYDLIPAPAANTTGTQQSQVATTSSGESNTRYRFVIAPDEFIQPGFSVKVQLTMPGYAIPKESIIEENGKNYVFVVKEGIAHKTEVKLERQGVQQVALTGLQLEDEVLMNPVDVKDGQAVTTGVGFAPEGETPVQ